MQFMVYQKSTIQGKWHMCNFSSLQRILHLNVNDKIMEDIGNAIYLASKMPEYHLDKPS